MTGIEDLDTYGSPNDLSPDDPAPREPREQPDVVTDEFRAWLFDSDTSETVQDTYVVDRNPDPLDFRMWVFVGKGARARFVMRASHRYSEEAAAKRPTEECCEVLFDGQSLRDRHCPATVRAFVEEVTGVTVETPTTGGRGGPVKY